MWGIASGREMGRDCWRDQLWLGESQGLELEVWEGLWMQWPWSGGVTMFGYLSPLVLGLFFLGGHRVHGVASDKQGLIGEFCADPGQEFFRVG